MQHSNISSSEKKVVQLCLNEHLVKESKKNKKERNLFHDIKIKPDKI